MWHKNEPKYNIPFRGVVLLPIVFCEIAGPTVVPFAGVQRVTNKNRNYPLRVMY